MFVVEQSCPYQEVDDSDKVSCICGWITDSIGIPIQHLQYLPYGEPYVNQHPFGYSERFTFTGKEKDEETGYGYFGARYMDHELMTMWLSVDPLADKYPNISPYNYCMWNPAKLVDPNGMDTAFAGDEERKLYYEYRNLVFSDDEKYGHIQKEITQMEKAPEVFCIRMGEHKTSSAGGGNFRYNSKTKQFDVNIDDERKWTNIQKLSHELKHVDQYLNRKLVFYWLTPSQVKLYPYSYSIDDELEAYARQGLFGDTWSSEEVREVYNTKYGLSWYGKNSQYSPTDKVIENNTLYQEKTGHPWIMYYGWEKDIVKERNK